MAKKITFTDEAPPTIRRPRRLAHAFERRLALCRWWLMQYRKAPRRWKPATILNQMTAVLAPERDKLVRLLLFYEEHHVRQRQLMDPVKVLTEPPAAGHEARWLKERGRTAAAVNRCIAQEAKKEWSLTHDAKALVPMVTSLQLDAPWVLEALAELQHHALDDVSPRRAGAERGLELIGNVLLKSGRGRHRRGPGMPTKRPHDPMRQLRSRTRAKLVNDIKAGAASGRTVETVADEVLREFMTTPHRKLSEQDRGSITRRVRLELNL